jgi:hypothetical protein
MWEKKYRFSLFVAIYQYLFWNNLSLDYSIDWDKILNEVFGEEVDFDNVAPLQKDFDFFLSKKESFDEILVKHLKDSSKTYDMVKAVLYTFLTETEGGEKDVEALEKIVGKYIRLTQEMVGGQSTALVHAVTSKVLEGKSS